MSLRNITLFTFLIFVLNCCAQVLPAPGAKLNYNQVMFEYPKVTGADLYIIQVTEGASAVAFNSRKLIQQKDSATATMLSGLKFGSTYQWRYAGIINGQRAAWHGPFSFKIVDDSITRKNFAKLVITKNDSSKSAGGLILIDATHTIIDRSGKMVWYLPDINWRFAFQQPTRSVNGLLLTEKSISINPVVFDLRLTPVGTITCLIDSQVAERNLSGNIIWQAPDNGKVSGLGGEGYNHDFKRMPNGHYMVLGNELWHKLPIQYSDTTWGKKKFGDRRFFNGQEYSKVEFGTVIEYDSAGNVVWSWNSRNYLEYDPLRPRIRNQLIEYPLKPHINAFSVDLNNEFVYVGFRDISRIVKVEKSTGKVVDSWGLRLYLGGANHPLGLHQQHDANILSDGNIAVFNSNDYPGSDSIPAAVIISQQPADSGKIIWQFDCQLDSAGRRANRNGGNVDELKNGNLLICTGTSDQVMEITKSKKIVWQCDIKNTTKDGIPYAHRLYRAHYISSLYPCYFVFVTDKDTVDRNSPTFKLRIFNKGSESDVYSVKISAGSTINQFSTDTITGNRSSIYTFNTSQNLTSGDNIEVTVSSLTNPALIKRLRVVVQ